MQVCTEPGLEPSNSKDRCRRCDWRRCGLCNPTGNAVGVAVERPALRGVRRPAHEPNGLGDDLGLLGERDVGHLGRVPDDLGAAPVELAVLRPALAVSEVDIVGDGGGSEVDHLEAARIPLEGDRAVVLLLPDVDRSHAREVREELDVDDEVGVEGVAEGLGVHLGARGVDQDTVDAPASYGAVGLPARDDLLAELRDGFLDQGVTAGVDPGSGGSGARAQLVALVEQTEQGPTVLVHDRHRAAEPELTVLAGEQDDVQAGLELRDALLEVMRRDTVLALGASGGGIDVLPLTVRRHEDRPLSLTVEETPDVPGDCERAHQITSFIELLLALPDRNPCLLALSVVPTAREAGLSTNKCLAST